MASLINSNLVTPTTHAPNSSFQDTKIETSAKKMFKRNCDVPLYKTDEMHNDKLMEIKNNYCDLSKKNKTSNTLKELVYFFKRDWPKDKKLEEFGFKLLCFLKDSWCSAKKILKNMLIKDLDNASDEQKKQCLEVIRSILFSSYFTPPGKIYTKSWFGCEIKYSAYSELFYDFLKNIDNIASKFELTTSPSKIDFAKKISSELSNLMHYVITRPWTTFLLTLSAQSSVASAGWKPKWFEKLQKDTQIIFNEINVTPAPIPGPYCGPDNFKPIAWVIADKWQFANIHVSFADSCKDHDSCWSDAHSHGDYNRCDDKFLDDLTKECHDKLTGNARNVCDVIATAYYGGVRAVTEARHFDL